MPGAMLVGWAADKLLGRKRTLIICLAVWVVLLVAAVFVRAKWQYEPL